MFLVANIYNIFCICKFSFFSSPKPIGGRYYKNDTEKDERCEMKGRRGKAGDAEFILYSKIGNR